MLLGQTYLRICESPLAAYNALQAALMRRFMNRGGSMEIWLTRFAPVYRQRYGWLVEEPAPVPVRLERGPRRPIR